jgi:hypothetical protein
MDGNSLEFREKRAATRYPVVLFAEFENGTGWARDIRTSGALIETSQSFFIRCSDGLFGASVETTRLRLYCKGVVVRAEQDGKIWRLGFYMEIVRFFG